jgi:multiple antibiotic resistance protein
MNQEVIQFLLAFIPIFVAVDVIGNIPIFFALTEGASRKERAKILRQSVWTATLVGIGFCILGKIVLRLLNVSITDFQIAGGALLFIIAVQLLLPGAHKQASSFARDHDVGVFPLGTPLITGPAVLTTTLMMIDAYGFLTTLISLSVNMLISWYVLHHADAIIRVVGVNGSRAFAKIMYILLAAIGVMMVRKGITGMFVS